MISNLSAQNWHEAPGRLGQALPEKGSQRGSVLVSDFGGDRFDIQAAAVQQRLCTLNATVKLRERVNVGHVTTRRAFRLLRRSNLHARRGVRTIAEHTGCLNRNLASMSGARPKAAPPEEGQLRIVWLMIARSLDVLMRQPPTLETQVSIFSSALTVFSFLA